MASTSHAALEGFAGAVAATTALAATYPLLTWTTRKQTARNHKLNRKRPYSGLPLALFGAAVSQGVYFALYAVARKRAVKEKAKRLEIPRSKVALTTTEALLVAAAAGAGNVLLTNPIWVLVTKLQVHGAQAAATRQQNASNEEVEASPNAHGSASETGASDVSVLGVFKTLLKDEGVLGLWKGVFPNLIMVINPTLQYALYERLVALRRSGRAFGGDRISTRSTFVDSMAAKLGATLLTYPILTIKARLQAQGKDTSPEEQYHGTLDAVRKIHVQEGIGAFYEGIGTKCVQSMSAAAILQTVKDEVVKLSKVWLSGVSQVT
mmetsp:Transcript_1239/g.8151  ORF Transcript_1239/g.8151 Transcript_1239/m.8151 type:complete len:322 (-) Transcript_1239:662-1627(-)